MDSLAPSPRITAKALSPQRGTGSGNVGMDVLGRLPDRTESRALEIALARAAAHRTAAQKKQERGNVFALTQAAIGREIAGLRDEVRKTSSDLVTTPQPQKQFASVVSSHFETPTIQSPETLRKCVEESPAEGEKIRLEQEVSRLRQIEIQYTTQSAILKDLESRNQNYTSTLMLNENTIALDKHELAECHGAVMEILEDRYKILSDQHKSIKSQLLEYGWKQSPSTDTAKQADASLQLLRASDEITVAKVLNVRDRVRDYESYITQLQSTVRKYHIDKVASQQSAIGGLQAKLSVADKVSIRASDELSSLKESIDARIKNGNQCAQDELNVIEEQSRLKIERKEAELNNLEKELSELKSSQQEGIRSAIEKERDRCKNKIETLEEELLTTRLDIQEKTRTLEHQLDIERSASKTARDSYFDTLESEKVKISESIDLSKQEQLELLRQERNRSYDRVRTLEAELDFKQKQLQTNSDLHEKKVIDEVNRHRADLEQQLNTAEIEFKKLQRRTESDSEAATKRHAEAVRLLEQQLLTKVMEAKEGNTLAEEAQSRCDSLRYESKNRVVELESELSRCAADLKDAEERLVQVASSQNVSVVQYQDSQSQLQVAMSKIVTISEELTHLKMQKGASGDALVESRKHSSSLGSQLAEALQRIIEIESRMSEKEVELQAAGAKAAMLDGCLAEATASLAAAETQLKLNADSKMENERSTAAAISRADAQSARASDLELKLTEGRSIESTLESHISELENRCSEYERASVESSKTLIELESELSGLCFLLFFY